MAIVNKRIKHTEPVDIEITGITLLSMKEYVASENAISAIPDFWWLRSSGANADIVACVSGYGSVIDTANHVLDCVLGVRPALVISNLKSVDLKKGDGITLAGYDWTVIDDRMALCNDIVGETCFRKDWKAKDANDYEASDIKKWLENWAKEKGVVD